MALTINLVPGYVYTDNEVDTAAKRNLAAKPTVSLEGSVSTLAIADGSVTEAKLAPGALGADATGQAIMAAGYFTADATGRGKFANNFLTAALAEETFREGVAQYAPGTWTINGGGPAGTYAVALSPAATAYTTGMRICFVANAISGGGDQVNVSGLGAINLMSQAGAPIAAGQIRSGQVVTCVYDGTNFQVENGDGMFITAATALSAGLMINVAHGLGIAPTSLRWVLRCQSPELGYVAGDEVDANTALFSSTPTLMGLVGGANATNVWMVCAQTTLSILRKDTFVQANITAASWKVVGYARR